ncbi:MAG: S1 RNA-binding domain-containing protein [Candidatus Aenigmarchaeota archaeon]|nr:S1 RNA-binding domain-containing protein [Candidatus Aenigmarchaeota archaeon]
MEEKIPKRWELVVCRIKKINPHSAIAYLVEYKRTGLIHVSEVASRWVRNIREFIKENQYVVCRVLEADETHISLSLKRVYREDSSRKLNEFKRERRAEKLIEMCGKLLKKSMEDARREIIPILIEEFGSLTKTFEMALRNPDLLKRKQIPEKWANAIMDIAKKNYVEKTFSVKGKLKLITHKPDGIEIIKKALMKAKKEGLEVQYISTPKYILIGRGKNYREVENKVRTIGEQIANEFEKNGEASFELEK